MGSVEKKELRRRNLVAKKLHEGRTGEYRQRIYSDKKSEYKRNKKSKSFNHEDMDYE